MAAIINAKHKLDTPRPYRVVDDQPEFLLIDKAPGVSVHRDDQRLGLLGQIAAEQGLKQLFLVHRLDKITSGLLLLAKTPEANRELSALFRERRMDKYYLALSDRKPKKKQGRVTGDMHKARRGAWKLTPGNENPAITRFFSRLAAPGLRLFIVRPHTGKTHQIRVALKSLGAPILGDSLYGGSSADRGYLHACALRFCWNNHQYQYLCLPSMGERFLPLCWSELLPEGSPWALPWPPL